MLNGRNENEVQQQSKITPFEIISALPPNYYSNDYSPFNLPLLGLFLIPKPADYINIKGIMWKKEITKMLDNCTTQHFYNCYIPT